MTRERYQQIRAIYLQARDLAGPARATYLAEACAADADLRAEVERYLASEQAATAFLESLRLAEQPGPAHAAPPLPQRIGHYRVLRQIGVGGMGVVYEAEQDRTQQRVALKLINAGVASVDALRRFELEAQVLGRLQHPGIARIFDADTFDAGAGPQPFFAMELADGEPLTAYADARQLSTRARLELVAKVADAVHHAHQRGVIHRDLKPGNILVTAAGQPKILDFGVARVTDGDIQATTQRTHIGQLIGTIPYMSPEQAAGDPQEPDTRSDVYALGVLAYELLAGRLPYHLKQKMIHEAVRVIQEDEPTRLSTGLGWHGRTGREFRGDIETIVGKALEKDKTRRYQSASDLATDIRRYLHDEPITARPPSAMYQLRKFARRNKTLVAGMAAVFVVLVAGIISTTMGVIRARVERTAAEQARALAEYQAYVAHVTAADLALAHDDPSTLRQQLGLAPPSLRNWEWNYLNTRSDRSLHTFRVDADLSSNVAISPDGRYLLCGASDGTAHVWDMLTQVEHSLPSEKGRFVVVAVFSPDGTRALTASDEGVWKLWEPPTFREVATWSDRGGQHELAAFAARAAVLVATCGHNAQVVDSIIGDRRVTLYSPTNPINAVALSADGTRVAIGERDGTARVWTIGSEAYEFVWRAHADAVQDIDFSDDQERILTASSDGTAAVWDLKTNSELLRLSGHQEWVNLARYCADGARIVTGSYDGTVRFWDGTTGEALGILQRRRSAINCLTTSTDRQIVVAGHADGVMEVWDTAGPRLQTVVRGHVGPPQSVALSRDHKWLASGDAVGVVKLWDAAGGDELLHFRADDDIVYACAFSADGSRLVTAGHHSVRLWDAGNGVEVARLTGHTSPVRSVACDPQGKSIMTGSDDQSAELWNLPTGVERGIRLQHKACVYGVAFDPTGRLAATVSNDGILRVWDIADGKELGSVRVTGTGFLTVAFSPDGARIATGSFDSLVRIWDVATLDAPIVLRGHSQAVYSVTFSPDGKQLASASGDDSVRFWNVAAGDESQSVVVAAADATCPVTFSPDGARLVLIRKGTPRLCDSRTGIEVLALPGSESPAHCAAISPDGTRIAAGYYDGTVTIWDSIAYKKRRTP